MIHVIATVELQPEKRSEFLSAFQKIVPAVLAEDGCIEYGPTIDLVTEIEAQSDPRENVVTIIEKWESLEHLEAHLIAPHMLEYRKEVKDLIASSELLILEPV